MSSLPGAFILPSPEHSSFSSCDSVPPRFIMSSISQFLSDSRFETQQYQGYWVPASLSRWGTIMSYPPSFVLNVLGVV